MSVADMEPSLNLDLLLKAIIELTTGEQVLTPMEWPFTQESNKEQFTDIRLSKSKPRSPFVNSC